MRFMLLLKGDPRPDQMPSPEIFEAMDRYNRALSDAGALLVAEGLLPSTTGARVTHDASGAHVSDGPFTESKELLAGFWMIQVASREEAVEWARRVPFEPTEEYGPEMVIEVRQVAELADFDDVPESVRQSEAQLRAKAAGAS
ncbi:YciI family protein [Georgenia ruanii]|uniref:YciI family protein n=1 Tax=Georgenia ruanii TaxID=348442 RepID=A0A7J9UX69_9MICO|nr:YciI family protein [Georgenia ruanii]MPV88963.1 YciI family protein [Georgenia ruanii]